VSGRSLLILGGLPVGSPVLLSLVEHEVQPVPFVVVELAVAADDGNFLGNGLRDGDSVGLVFVGPGRGRQARFGRLFIFSFSYGMSALRNVINMDGTINKNNIEQVYYVI